MKQNLEDATYHWINIILLTLVAALALFPLYYIFVVSFTDPDEYMQNPVIWFPSKWSIISYQYMLSSNSFVKAMGTSTFLATVGTAFSLIVTSAGAYAISRKRLTGRRIILLMVLLTTLFNPGIIPPYLVVRELGLINSVWSLIFPVLSSGFYVLLMKGFFESIPDSLEEAARIDGCSDIGIFFRVILPLSLPALAAFGLFYAVGYWNTYFSAILYINQAEKWPLQVLLSNMLVDASASASGAAAAEIAAQQQIPLETKKMASVVIATLPILLVYPFLQKHFAKGAMIGSVKG
jgi:putative aldouronate transport system permease protein